MAFASELRHDDCRDARWAASTRSQDSTCGRLAPRSPSATVRRSIVNQLELRREVVTRLRCARGACWHRRTRGATAVSVDVRPTHAPSVRLRVVVTYVSLYGMPSRWPAARVKALRGRLGLSIPDFARLVGVEPRTVYRWESPTKGLRPSGPAEAVLTGLASKIEGKTPSTEIVKFLGGVVAIGGLAYLLSKLLDEID